MDTVVVFTRKDLETMFEQGGCGDWVASEDRLAGAPTSLLRRTQRLAEAAIRQTSIPEPSWSEGYPAPKRLRRIRAG